MSVKNLTAASFLVSFVFLLISCEGSIEPKPDTRLEFEIDAYDYSEKHFFLDTIYASRLPEYNFFDRFYNIGYWWYPASEWFYEVTDLEVWKSYTGQDRERSALVNAFMNLPPVDSSKSYSDFYRNKYLDNVKGEVQVNTRFIKLVEGLEYEYNAYLGYISFREEPEDFEAVAVAYRIQGNESGPEDDLIFGEFNNSLPDSAVVILKLVKPIYLRPEFNQAWKLQLRNIYSIGSRYISREGFMLEILYKVNEFEYNNSYDGNYYSPMFGMADTNGIGSASINFFYSRVLPVPGEIFFPKLEPFGRDFPDALPYEMSAPEIYSRTKIQNESSGNNTGFLIHGKFNRSEFGKQK